MNGLRRIPRIFAKVTAAFAVMVAIAVPASIMSAGVAGAATAPTLSTTSTVNYNNSPTGYAIVGQGYSGTIYFVGTGFADDQGTGGNVTISTGATGASFSNIIEQPGGTEVTATLTTTSATPAGFYPITFTDDNGTVSMPLGLGIDVGPQITTIAGNSGVGGGGASTITITGMNLEGATPTFAAPAGCTAPPPPAYSGNNTSMSITVNNSTATACVDTLILTSPYPSGGQGMTVAAYTVNAHTTALSITAVTPNSLSITGLSGASPTTTSTVTISGTGFEPGAVGTLSNLEAGDIAGGFTYVNSTTMTGSITLTFGVTATQENITITNPDATSITGTGILGIGEAAASTPVSTVAPTIACPPTPNLQAGVQTVFSCTGSSTFPITSNTSFVLSYPGNTTSSEMVTGTVLNVTNNVALINANIPRFSDTATSAALTGGTSTSVTVASTAGMPATPFTAWIADGASTEQVSVTGAAGNTVTFSAAVANSHASGVELEWLFKTGVNYTVTANNGTNAATSNIPILAANAPAYNGGVTAGSFNPGSYTINANVPGFGFTSGASIYFLGATGSTGTVTPVNYSNATISVTVPTTVPETVTLAANANAGQDQATLSDDTHVSVGQSLTVGPNPLDATKTTQTLVVATVGGGGVVTFTTNFAQTYLSGDAVAGITVAQPIGNLNAVLTNGSGQAILITPLLGIAAVGTATLTTPASGALGDGAGAGSGPNFFPFPPEGGYPVEFTVAGGTLTGTGWTITSTTAGVTFANATVASGNTIDANATVASNVAASSTVPVTITNGQLTFTGTFTVDSTVPTVSGVTTVGSIGPANTSEIIGVYGTNFNTADPAVNDYCSTTAPGVYCTIYDNGDTPPGGSTVTTDTATTLTVVVYTDWYFAGYPASNWPEPFPSNGSFGISIGQYSDGGAGLFSPAGSVAGEPTVATVSPLTIDAGVAPGTVSVTGAGFIGSGTLGNCERLYATPGSTVYSAVGGCTAVANSATSVTITDSSTYSAGSVEYEFGDSWNTWQVVTPAIQVINAPVPNFFVFGNDLSINFGVAGGSTNAPFKLVGSGFLPGTTLSIPAADGTITTTLVTPNAIFGTVSVGDLNEGDYPVTVTNANGTTGTVNMYVYWYPYISTINGTATSAVLEGTGTKLVLTGSNFVAGATVALTNPALGTFGTAVVTNSAHPTDTCTTYAQDCDTLTVTVTPLTFEGATPIVTGITVTNPVGDGSYTVKNSLTINPVPVVTGSYFVPTFSSNLEVTINGNGFQQGMTVSATNSPAYTVLLVSVNAAGTSAVLLVTTTSAATTGTSSTVTFTNPDGGAVSFPLDGGPAPTPNLHVTGIGGRPAHIGKSVTFTITGSSLTASTVSVSGHKGVSVHKLSNSSTVIKVKVTVKKGTSVGKAFLHVTNSNGTATLAFSIKK